MERMTLRHHIGYWVAIAIVASVALVFVSHFGFAAWTDPTASPPNGNLPPPFRPSPSSAQTNTTTSTTPGIWFSEIGSATKLMELLDDATSRFVVQTDGNVGIGTAAPAAKLHVMGNIMLGTQPGYTNQFSTDANYNLSIKGVMAQSDYFNIQGTGTTDNGALEIVTGDNGNEPIIFKQTSGATQYERMRIDPSGNVGIGTAAPGATLEVNGGIRLNTTTARPTCSASQRGTLWFTQGGAGVKDSLAVCAKDATDTYAWRTLY